MSADPAAALSYRDHLPLAWHALPEGETTPTYEHENLSTLFAVSALEEHRDLPAEDGPLHEEIHRLHQKMDLLVNMMCSLIRTQTPHPPAVALQLSAQRLSWQPQDGPRPDVGMRVLLEIYLHNGMTQPLRLPARVISASDAEAVAEFEPLAENSLAALERHVFLHHRRSIAGARQAAQR